MKSQEQGKLDNKKWMAWMQIKVNGDNASTTHNW